MLLKGWKKTTKREGYQKHYERERIFNGQSSSNELLKHFK